MEAYQALGKDPWWSRKLAAQEGYPTQGRVVIYQEVQHMTLVQFFGAIAKLSGLIFVVTAWWRWD